MRKLNMLSTLAAILLLSASAIAQGPAIKWSQLYGGNQYDGAWDVKPTKDGGYIIAGSTGSTKGTGDVSDRIAGKESDYWVVKTDADGKLEWEKVYGGYEGNTGRMVVPTKDGGYIIGGTTRSNSGDVSHAIGHMDLWIVKVKSNGDYEWDLSLGGTDQDELFDLKQTKDEGFIVSGYASESGFPKGTGFGSFDCYVAKVDKKGKLEWESINGGTGLDEATSVIELKDGGFMVAGFTGSDDGDVKSGMKGDNDYWVYKLDTKGKLEWEKTFGGKKMDYNVGSIVQTADGNFVVAGISQSSNGDGDVVRRIDNTQADLWIFKFDTKGKIMWNKAYGGSGHEYNPTMSLTADGGLIVSSTTNSDRSGDITDAYGDQDFWILKLDSKGELEWQKTLGGKSREDAGTIYETSNGGYILTGSSESTDGDLDKLKNNGSADVWLVHLAPPSVDKIKVETVGGVAATITTLGGQLPLKATIFPSSVSQAVTWSIVPGTGTASINASGNVTAVSNGTVWGKAVSVLDPAKKDSIQITISGQSVDSIRVKTQGGVAATITTLAGTLQLTSNIYPSALNQTVTWSIVPGTGTASINASGNVTAVSNGTVWGKAVSVFDPTKRDSIRITISGQSVDSIRVKTQGGVAATITTLAGALQLTSNIYPSALNQAVTWSVVPGTGAATINASGNVTAVSNGTVWGKAVSVFDPTKRDSILITITGQSVDSIRVKTQGSVAATIHLPGGMLPLVATIYPLGLSQAVTWSIVPGTGAATINTSGEVTAITNGTVWGKAVSVLAPGMMDSIEITISGQPVLTVDSIRVSTFGNVPAEITTQGGTLQLASQVYPVTVNQAVTWSIVPGTGAATVNATGLITAQSDGTVWGKAVSVADPGQMDSILITLSGQTSGYVSGINERKEALLVYPNPVTNMMFVRMDGTHPPLMMTVWNMDGRLVQKQEIAADALNNPLQVNTGNLSSGIYLIKLEGDHINISSIFTKK